MADPAVKAARSILDAQPFGVRPAITPTVEYETAPTGMMKVKTPVPTVKLKRRNDIWHNGGS